MDCHAAYDDDDGRGGRSYDIIKQKYLINFWLNAIYKIVQSDT